MPILTAPYRLLLFLLFNFVTIMLCARDMGPLLTLWIDGSTARATAGKLDPPAREQFQLIPKLIHQTYKDEAVPEQWRVSQQSCLNLHPDYNYTVSRLEGGRAALKRLKFQTSSGPTKCQETSSPMSTAGFWILSTVTCIPFSGWMPSAISS